MSTSMNLCPSGKVRSPFRRVPFVSNENSASLGGPVPAPGEELQPGAPGQLSPAGAGARVRSFSPRSSLGAKGLRRLQRLRARGKGRDAFAGIRRCG